MKPQHLRQRTGGFTGWDLLVVIVTLGLLIVVLMVPGPRPGGAAKASTINCVSNLKQIGLAFRMWANDHGEKFPMALSSFETNGGTLEFNLTGEVWRHFQIISNELNNPKVLACSLDKKRARIADWHLLTNNAYLSYFAGLDANETNPQSILSGDRNLTGTAKLTNGVLPMTAADQVEWTKDIHNQRGNIALGDGSAHQMTQGILAKQFQAVFLSTTQTIHRLALPK